MSRSSRLEASGLLTREPHHLPGYGGFCPQFKFRYGKTFGHMTADLLTDDDINSSGRPVLHELDPDTSGKEEVDRTRDYLASCRSYSLGEEKFVENVIPGYAGFVPRSQNYFGSRFSDVCKHSTADLELDYRKYKFNKNQLKFVRDVQEGKIQLDPQHLPPHLSLSPRPLVPIAEAPPIFFHDTQEAEETASPYKLSNLDPNKNFMSGFTGFVPRSRDLLGAGYPVISNRGLSRFTSENNKSRHLKNQPILVQSALTPPPEGRRLYPAESGMIPRYTGHVPGERFRFDATYGTSTEDARRVLPDVA